MSDRIVERETVEDDGAPRRTVEEKVTHVGHGHGEEVGGAVGGAATGAVVGSVVPGVGTAVGAVVGGAMGALAGKADEEEKGTTVETTTRSR